MSLRTRCLRALNSASVSTLCFRLRSGLSSFAIGSESPLNWISFLQLGQDMKEKLIRNVDHLCFKSCTTHFVWKMWPQDSLEQASLLSSLVKQIAQSSSPLLTPTRALLLPAAALIQSPSRQGRHLRSFSTPLQLWPHASFLSQKGIVSCAITSIFSSFSATFST